MTDRGPLPPRDSRRAGDNSEFLLGADGQPILDRYGRPIRRRIDHRRAGDTPPQRRPRRVEPEQQSFPRVAPPQETRYDLGRPAQQPPAYQPRYQPGYQPRYQPPPPAQYAPPAPPRRRRRKRANPLKFIALCLAAILVFTLAFVLWTDTRLTRIDAMPEQQVANTAGTNWLLVGSDSRLGLSEEDQAELGTGGDVGTGRTDTIMLLHTPRSGGAKLVSIPRDSYVNVPGFGEDKINAAFTYGGPQLLTQTVEQATGLHIDHYAEIGMGGLASVVDAVGGVEMCLDEPISDPLAAIDLPAGCQELDGPNALGYVRTRATAMGDLDRVERQREFFAALLHKVTAPATFINPVRAISLVNSTASTFTVDQGDHVWHLARVALAMSSGVETETVPVSGFMDTYVGNVVLWDEAGAAELWNSMK